MEAELMAPSPAEPVEMLIEQERRFNRNNLFTTYCGLCRWGTEKPTKGHLRRAIEEHLDERHEGVGVIVDKTTRMRTFYRYYED